MTTQAIKTTDVLKHTIRTTDSEGNPLHIEIRLGDYRLNKSNGHADFAITATGWQKGKPLNDRNMIYGGCCHEEILKARPDLQQFVDLHLSDQTGAPMHPTANGLYFIREGKEEVAREHFRATPEEFEILKYSENETECYMILLELGIIARWATEAAAAQKQLEEWTGQKFAFEMTRGQLVAPSAEVIADFQQKKKAGYFTPENKEARKIEAAKQAIAKAYREIDEARDKEILKANNEHAVKTELLRVTGRTDWAIYYTHTNEVSFNWRGYDPYTPKVTPEMLAEFVPQFNLSKLPEGITFTLSKKS